MYAHANSFTLQNTGLAARKDAQPFGNGVSMLPVLQHTAFQQQMVAMAAARNASFSQQQRPGGPLLGLGASPAKTSMASTASGGMHGMSPLHMAALGASGSQTMSRASSPGVKSRSTAIDANSSNSASTTNKDEEPLTLPPAVPSSGPSRPGPPRTAVRNLGNTFNRASCPGTVAMSSDPHTLTSRRSIDPFGPGGARQSAPQQAAPFGGSALYSQMLAAQGGGGTGYAALQAQAAAMTVPSAHIAQSMFTFGPTPLSGYSDPSRAASGDAACSSSLATAGGLGSSLRRTTPILSVMQDSPAKKDSLSTPGGAAGSFGSPGSLSASVMATPRRSSAASYDFSAPAASGPSVTTSVTTSLGLRPSTGLSAAGSPLGGSPFKVQQSGMSVTRAAAAGLASSSPLPSRLSHAEAPGPPPAVSHAGRSSSLPRVPVKLTAGGDPLEEEEDDGAMRDGNVRHWRHPPPPPREEKQQQQQQQQPRQQPPLPPQHKARGGGGGGGVNDDDGSDVGGSRSEDGEMEASDDDEYEEEAPPPPPSERTLAWLEATTQRILSKAKVPGVSKPMDSLF